MNHASKAIYPRTGVNLLPLLLVILGGAASLGGVQAEVPQQRPNILLILVDDLGYGDLSSYGARDLYTPNIDTLVSEGMRFDRFYANSPVCSPTRAALLSGRYQDLVGVPGVIRTKPGNSWGNLSPDAVLLPEYLKQAEYNTAIIGKWHLGLKTPDTPNDRGFDHFHGFLGDMMDDYWSHRRGGINFMRQNNRVIDPEGHATDLFSKWACDYLQKQAARENPFFLYLAYNAPHTPIQPPEEHLLRVQKREPGIGTKRARLVALIEHLDAGIGSVLRTLDEVGLSSNTLVAFTSDNGGQPRVGASNGDLKLGKGTLYEGGIRVPAAIRWSGTTIPGSSSDCTLLTMDLLPTLLEVASVNCRQEFDGVSFAPVLLGREFPEPERDLFWGRREGPDRWFKEAGVIYAVRRGSWKLLQARPGAPYELYRLDADPLERNDLAHQELEIYQELFSSLQAQIARFQRVPWMPEIDPEESELMTVLEKGEFFQLRERLRTPKSETSLHQLFFLAASQNAFNQSAASNQTIQSFLHRAALPNSSLIQLLQIQASNHFRQGQYKEAYNVAKQVLALPAHSENREEIDDVRNLSRLLEPLLDIPPQSVKRSGDTTLTTSGEFHYVPVEIGDSIHHYMLDTGANLSVLMRSEAIELDLQIRAAGFQVGTTTDLEVQADLAVAENLRIGNLQFKNVIFMVFPDEALSFAEANMQIPGIIGFPVIEAMGEVQYRKDGTIAIPGEVPVRSQQNLALDELDPRIAVQYKSDTLICRLDTGANKTEFYAPFFNRYRSYIEARSSLQTSKTTGAGGTREFSAHLLPDIALMIGDTNVSLEEVTVYTEPFGEDREHLSCNLGLDILGQFGGYSINFRDMALVLE